MADRLGARLVLLFTCVAAGALLHAQAPTQISREAHESRLPQLRGMVQECAGNAKLCAPERVGPDESLTLPGGVETQVHYAWLRQTLTTMAKQNAKERGEAANSALEKLSAVDQSRTRSALDALQASRAAAQVLSQVEFSQAKQSWISKQWDRFTDWLSARLTLPGVGHGTRRWLRILVEAMLFGTPLLLLMLWLLRQSKEDQFRAESPPAEIGRKARESEIAWLQAAQECARRGQWREAVHALYWQTVSTLENRHLLSASRTRTPRESLRLLEPGSPARRVLREQTNLLEKVWYGRTPATEEDYQQARLLQEEVPTA